MCEYAVKVKCGHVGINKYIVKTLPIRAGNMKEAAKKARWTPRVKHHWKDAIIDVLEVSKKEYDTLVDKYTSDPYFKFTRIQDQRMKCVDIHLHVRDVETEEKNDRPERIKYLMKKRRVDEQLHKYNYDY